MHKSNTLLPRDEPRRGIALSVATDIEAPAMDVSETSTLLERVRERRHRPSPVPKSRRPIIEARPVVRGKFLFEGQRKLWVKGVTYGSFRPDEQQREYQDLDKIERDFAQMSAAGFNTVRIPHAMPPRHLLDIAQKHGLRVMVGLSAEQYAGYLIDTEKAPDILAIVREKVRTVAGHPALLCYSIGNEIAAPLVRWIGRKRVEKYIHSVYRAIKSVDPDGLVTYVNYPTTEYLQLPFLDLVAFNAYLESPDQLEAYLARLQNLAGERPLLMSEVGLDALRHGEEAQARSLACQVRTAFASGCAGIVIFAWTDEWFHAGVDVEGWAFGLTTGDRRPRNALAAVSRALTQVPFPSTQRFPRVSVVVCSYNGSATIRDTLDHLQRLDYPDYEVIVISDGSTDATAAIARQYDVRLIETDNRGLSNARNTGWQEATGEIIAYIDDDAYPDPHWLQFLAYTFVTSDYVGVGGPNIAPPEDGSIAQCVANSPGGPVHVLISDREAEHIPGCNMAFKRSALAAIGGFDPRYRTAGDDVDVCWRLEERGWKLGFHAGAMNWHHRRNSVKMYWRQQTGYGKAEALLEAKWPERYNGLGHTTWAGKLYGRGLTLPLWIRQHVYGGIMGSAPFQSLYERGPGTFTALPLMPEWYLLIVALCLLALLGLAWPPLVWAVVPLALAVAAPLCQAAISASRARFPDIVVPPLWPRVKRWALTAFLHLLQPAARLRGRYVHGLTLFRRRGDSEPAFPLPRTFAHWREHLTSPESRPYSIAEALRANGHVIMYGGPYDRWDLEVVGGLLGGARMLMAVENHGGGAHYIRVRMWPRLYRLTLVASAILAGLALFAALDAAWWAASILIVLTLSLFLRGLRQSAFAIGALVTTEERFEQTS